MTTTTSTRGARLQQDQRLQPLTKPRRKSRITAASQRLAVAAANRSPTNKSRAGTTKTRRSANVPSAPRLAIQAATQASLVSEPVPVASKTKRSRSAYELLATPITYLLGISALWIGWLYRDSRAISAESGLGYALGVVAVGCMVTLLVYPVRKRFRFLRFIGSVKNWFRTHMMLGALGPIAALYHCNFQLGSLNSQVALYSALLVAGSGLVGRVIYRKMNQNLYGNKTNFNQLRRSLQSNQPQLGSSLTFLPLIATRIKIFDQRIFIAGKRLWPSLCILPMLGRRARREKRALLAFADQQLTKMAGTSPIVKSHQRRLSAVLDRYLYLHMAQARKLARLQLYERLFALWHVVHLPFFFMLVVSTFVHVFAVHLY